MKGLFMSAGLFVGVDFFFFMSGYFHLFILPVNLSLYVCITSSTCIFCIYAHLSWLVSFLNSFIIIFPPLCSSFIAHFHSPFFNFFSTAFLEHFFSSSSRSSYHLFLPYHTLFTTPHHPCSLPISHPASLPHPLTLPHLSYPIPTTE